MIYKKLMEPTEFWCFSARFHQPRFTIFYKKKNPQTKSSFLVLKSFKIVLQHAKNISPVFCKPSEKTFLESLLLPIFHQEKGNFFFVPFYKRATIKANLVQLQIKVEYFFKYYLKRLVFKRLENAVNFYLVCQKEH